MTQEGQDVQNALRYFTAEELWRVLWVAIEAGDADGAVALTVGYMQRRAIEKQTTAELTMRKNGTPPQPNFSGAK